MSAKSDVNNHMLEDVLKGLDLNRHEVRIYLELLETGSSTAGNLAKKLGTPRATLYDTLQRLTDKGVIFRSLKYGVRSFRAETPEKLTLLFDKRIKDLRAQQQQFNTLIPELNKKSSGGILAPRFEFFEGVEAVKYAMQDFLSYRDIESLNFWYPHVSELMGPQHFYYSSGTRIKQNIWQKLIVPYDPNFRVKDHPYGAGGEMFKRELRIAPKGVDTVMSYWVYQDKVLYLSSRAEAYAYIVESKEMAQMMRQHFMAVWKLSTPYKMQDGEADKFIEYLKKL